MSETKYMTLRYENIITEFIIIDSIKELSSNSAARLAKFDWKVLPSGLPSLAIWLPDKDWWLPNRQGMR